MGREFALRWAAEWWTLAAGEETQSTAEDLRLWETRLQWWAAGECMQMRKGRPATGRPLLRENSSNGGKAIRTFLSESYVPPGGVSSQNQESNKQLIIINLKRIYLVTGS